STLLRGLSHLQPRPLPVLLRELQAAGGELDVESLRLVSGSLTAIGSGTLRLSAHGRLDGELMLTIAGFDPKTLGPLLADSDVKRVAGLSLLALLGRPAQLDGRPAVRMPLRFADGTVSLGPLPL